MLFQRINRTDPEKVFVIVKNSYSTATLTNGQAVIWDFQTDVDGVGVTMPTARATNVGFAAAGIVAESIASDAYGLVQVYGYHGAVRARAYTSGTPAGMKGNIVKGMMLTLNTAGSLFCLEDFFTATNSAATDYMIFPCAFAMSIWSSWTTSTIKAFIKCM